MMIFRPKPVLEDKGRYAEMVQPDCNVGTFFYHRKVLIAAARTNDYSCGNCTRSLRRVRRQSRFVNVLTAESARCSIRPKQHRLGILCLCRKRHERRE